MRRRRIIASLCAFVAACAVIGWWWRWPGEAHQDAADVAAHAAAAHETPWAPPAGWRDVAAVAGGDRAVPPPSDGAKANDAGAAPAARPAGALANEFTVSFRDGASMRAFRAAAEARGLRVIGELPGLFALRVRGDERAAHDLLSDDATLDFNFRVETPPVPDPVIADREGLRPFGSGSLAFLGVADGAGADWGAGVKVAILDTVYREHPALAGADIRAVNLIEVPAGGGGAGGATEAAMAGHATAVAALIAGDSPMVQGLAPGVSLTVYGVLGADGSGDAFSLAAGLMRAVDDGARVINLSLGSRGDTLVLRQAVDYALARGAVLVASAGNDGAGALTWPAAYDGVIAVGAVDANGRYPSFSNRGAALDVVAPGVGVNTAWSDGAYVIFDGTSSAAPFVSAAAAVLLAEQPGLSAAAVAGLVRDYSNDAGAPGVDPLYGAGVLNMERLLRRDERGIVDLAVGDFHFAVENTSGGSIPLQVSFQNRGTEFVSGGSLDVTVGGVRYSFAVPVLAPNAVGAVSIPVNASLVAAPDGLAIDAHLRAPSGDAHPENDTRRARVQLIMPGD